jgi:hypothetical protein
MARSRQRHPFLASARIRARELSRRPSVLGLFAVQLLVVVAVDLERALDLTGAGLGGDGDLVVTGLRAATSAGALVFGVLAAAVVGAEFAWSTERALLARDPRRPRFVALQLTIVVALAVVWIVVQTLFAVAAGLAIRRLTGDATPAIELADAGTLWRPVAALAASTLIYGLLGATFALGLRGSLAGAVAVLAYGLVGELVVGPLWLPAGRWTIRSAADSLAATGGGLTLDQSLWVLGAATVVALIAAFAVYAAREVRD